MTLKQRSEKIKVLVEVYGGNVQNMYADGPVDMQIVDWDNIAAGDSPPERIYFIDGVTAKEFMIDELHWF